MRCKKERSVYNYFFFLKYALLNDMMYMAYLQLLLILTQIA